MRHFCTCRRGECRQQAARRFRKHVKHGLPCPCINRVSDERVSGIFEVFECRADDIVLAEEGLHRLPSLHPSQLHVSDSLDVILTS